MLKDLPENKLTEAVICAAPEVHRTLGPGLKEEVYEGVLVDEEVLPQHLVRVKPVADAPILDLRWTCQIHFV